MACSCHVIKSGELETFWLKPVSVGPSGDGSSHPSSHEVETEPLDLDRDGLVDIETAIAHLPGPADHKQAWASRNCKRISWVTTLLADDLKSVDSERATTSDPSHGEFWHEKDTLKLDAENDFDQRLLKAKKMHATPEAPQRFNEEIARQLHAFVARVAYLCKDSPFHNFEHTLIVVMCANRILKQLKATSSDSFESSAAATFAVLFAALIHDLKASDASESAENPAANAAWDILQDDNFGELRTCICASEAEMKFFWKLVTQVLSVSEETVSSETSQRWNEAFGEGMAQGAEKQSKQVLATLEHVIILSQATHSLQHWDNFLEWSEKWHEETSSDMANCSASVWYRHELNYFDKFVIPSAEKVKEAGVLGALGNEILIYAQQNRREWGKSGEQLASKFSIFDGQEKEGVARQPSLRKAFIEEASIRCMQAGAWSG